MYWIGYTYIYWFGFVEIYNYQISMIYLRSKCQNNLVYNKCLSFRILDADLYNLFTYYNIRNNNNVHKLDTCRNIFY